MRITHRRCRSEVAALDAEAVRLTTEAETLTGRNETLTDDLQAAEHAMDEVVAACRNLDYAATEAVIPDVLRNRLMQLAALTTKAEVEFLTA